MADLPEALFTIIRGAEPLLVVRARDADEALRVAAALLWADRQDPREPVPETIPVGTGAGLQAGLQARALTAEEREAFGA